jgi:hypothetical protein
VKLSEANKLRTAALTKAPQVAREASGTSADKGDDEDSDRDNDAGNDASSGCYFFFLRSSSFVRFIDLSFCPFVHSLSSHFIGCISLAND